MRSSQALAQSVFGLGKDSCSAGALGRGSSPTWPRIQNGLAGGRPRRQVWNRAIGPMSSDRRDALGDKDRSNVGCLYEPVEVKAVLSRGASSALHVSSPYCRGVGRSAMRSVARATIASPYIRQLRSGLPQCCMHGLSLSRDGANLGDGTFAKQASSHTSDPPTRPGAR